MGVVPLGYLIPEEGHPLMRDSAPDESRGAVSAWPRRVVLRSRRATGTWGGPRSRFRGASILLTRVVRVGREVLATGSTEGACLSLEEGFRPTPLPDDIRSALERYLAG